MRKLLLNDGFILTLIILNALIIFIQSFDGLTAITKSFLSISDVIVTFVFVLEIATKIRINSFKVFYSSNWNKFDFYLIIFSAVSILLSFSALNVEDFSFILVLRVARIFKAFRFLKFIPNINELLKGIQRAIKASVLVIFSLIVYNFILAVFSCYLFKEVAPEYFGNPLQSLYSIFRIFTVEGWYEIPDIIAEKSSATIGILSTVYFVLILVSGGILGLSLMNSIFVDAMVADNNDALEEKVEKLSNEISRLSSRIENLTNKN